MQNLLVDELRYEPYDVLIAGGGMAGIASAIASGRTGAKTILIEKAGWLGGMNIVDCHSTSVL
jgi:heterodisulfide reductase subunit A-like polyferredoxin